MSSSDPSPHDWREWRRLRALDLAHQGWKQQDIAVALDTTQAAVSQWLAAAHKGGKQALLSHPSPGRPPRLSEEQWHRLPDLLWHGAESYGFAGDLWTCERIVGMLAQEFEISYSKSQVSRLLKDLGWTPQMPITRAIQRDEEAITNWRVHTWPLLKEKARRERRQLIFVDESGFYLLPSVVKTYAPRGQTPILDQWQTRDHLSVMGGVTLTGKVYTLVRPQSLNGLHTMAFLAHLQKQIPGRLLVIWDGSQIHRRAEVKAFVAAQPGTRIHLEALPPYAPDLNPVEWLWQHLKNEELSNRTCLDLEQLHQELHLALERVRQAAGLVHSFFEAALIEPAI
jgi:transposase